MRIIPNTNLFLQYSKLFSIINNNTSIKLKKFDFILFLSPNDIIRFSNNYGFQNMITIDKKPEYIKIYKNENNNEFDYIIDYSENHYYNNTKTIYQFPTKTKQIKLTHCSYKLSNSNKKNSNNNINIVFEIYNNIVRDLWFECDKEYYELNKEICFEEIDNFYTSLL